MSTLADNQLTDAVYDLITHYANDYDKNNIFLGNQNGYVQPKDGRFIIFWIISTKALGKPSEIQQYDTENDVTYMTYQAVRNALIQLDYYGDLAELNSNKMATMLRASEASRFLGKYGFSLGEFTDVINLTNEFDSETYLARYSVTFNVFYDAVVDIENQAFNEVKIKDIKFIEGDKII